MTARRRSEPRHLGFVESQHFATLEFGTPNSFALTEVRTIIRRMATPVCGELLPRCAGEQGE
jgi:hypothetical protein